MLFMCMGLETAGTVEANRTEIHYFQFLKENGMNS